MNKQVYIYGASGHGKVVLEVCRSAGIQVRGFIDDDKKLKKCQGLEVIHHVPADARLVLGVGRNSIRKKLLTKFNERVIDFTSHKDATIAQDAILNTGTVVMPRAVINASCKIGKGVIINTSSVIEHDCTVGDFAHISPGAVLCGDVQIGELSQVGANAVVLPGIKIGKNCIVGAGAVVTRDVDNNQVVVGNPAKPI
jgi:acetyltransferase EpsM